MRLAMPSGMVFASKECRKIAFWQLKTTPKFWSSRSIRCKGSNLVTES